MPKNHSSYRIKTNVIGGQPYKLNVKLDQTFDTVDILSLNINQTGFYKTHSSDYGCIIGRVQANGGVGIPNVKISIFIKATDETKEYMEKSIIYPYNSPSDKNYQQIQYNTLSSEQIDECYAIVGTMPSKRLILDDDLILEVYDEYYKFTTISNTSGDYMIFGVPTGTQTVHCDVDLSDCGMLSQKPRDMYYKGYTEDLFENSNQFKQDTNLNNLAQIITQNQSVYVYPFWGDNEDNENSITRCDIDVAYKFESTCIFIGSAITDSDSFRLLKNCLPQDYLGVNSKLIARGGTIEMIRKTYDGTVEFFQIKGNQLIDGNGVWCYQIPMNLDYVVTNEYGDLVPTDDIEKGIATTAKVRFRVGLDNELNSGRQRALYLIPHNPEQANHVDYEFGENTIDESYAILMKNKVYSVKSYIPRLQSSKSATTMAFFGIKTTNADFNNNPFPFNKLYVRLSFVFVLLCALAGLVIFVVDIINMIMSWLSASGHKLCFKFLFSRKCPLDFLSDLFCGLFPRCLTLKGWCPIEPMSEKVPAPGCHDKDYDCLANKTRQLECDGDDCPEIMWSKDELKECVIASLAQEFEVYKFNFYNHWINGCLYFPPFDYIYRKKVKRKWMGLFGPKRVNEQILFCGLTNEMVSNAAKGSLFSRGINSFKLTDNFAIPMTTKKNGRLYLDFNNADVKHVVKKPEKTFDVMDKKDLGEGVINKIVNKDETYKFYYRVYNKQFSVKLLLTDIILLGSLDSCDIDGIPPLHKYLPTTSFSIPSVLYNMVNPQSPDTGTGNFEEYGEIVATGIIWGNDIDRINNVYPQLGNAEDVYPVGAKGLLLGLGCFNAYTVWKSNINCMRMCELNVQLDSTEIKYGRCFDGNPLDNIDDNQIPPDGMLTQRDIVKYNEARQMFATLNSKRLVESNVVKSKNGRKYYQFDYLYPNNFDGLNYYNLTKGAYNEKKKNFDDGSVSGRNTKEEYYSDDYYRFLFGNSLDINNTSAYPQNKNYYSTFFRMPIYVNSFYFYFGLIPGESAIEQFRKKFFSECVIPDNKGIKVQTTVLRNAYTCTKCTTTLPGVEFNVTVKEFNGSYKFHIEDSYGAQISLKYGTDTNCDSSSRFSGITTETLKFRSYREAYPSSDINGYYYLCSSTSNPNYNHAGTYYIIIEDETGKTKEGVINIKSDYSIMFDGEVTQDILTDLNPLCSDTTSDSSVSCNNNMTTCICCSDYLTIPTGTNNPASMKGIFTIKDLTNTTIKGCSLCNYKLTITRKLTIGVGLILELTVDANGTVTSIKVGYVDGVLQLGSRFIVANNVPLPGGINGSFNITSVNTSGGVIGVSVNQGGSGYQNGNTETIANIEVEHSTTEYYQSVKRTKFFVTNRDTGWDTDTSSVWANICNKINDDITKPQFKIEVNSSGTIINVLPVTGGYPIQGFNPNITSLFISSENGTGANITPNVNTNWQLQGFTIVSGGTGYVAEDYPMIYGFNSIPIYACDGNYTIRIENMVTRNGTVPSPPSGTTDLNPDGCGDDFYELTFDLTKRVPLDLTFYTAIKSKKLEIKGVCSSGGDAYNPQTNEGGCYCDSMTNINDIMTCKHIWFINFTNYLNQPYENITYNSFLNWYNDPEMTVEDFGDVIQSAKKSFMSTCPGDNSLLLGGTGYMPNYRTFTYGARGYPLTADPYYIMLATTPNQYINIYYANDSNNKGGAVSITLPSGDVDIPGFNVVYSTNKGVFGSGLGDLTAGFKKDDNGNVTPDGAVFSFSAWDATANKLPDGYTIGGYFSGVVGDSGQANGNTPSLAALINNPTTIKPVTAWALQNYLNPGILPTPPPDPHTTWLERGNQYFFFYHIVDRRMEMVLKYSRVAAFHKGYLKPDTASRVDLSGYFDIYYKNGPDIELVYDGGDEVTFNLTVENENDGSTATTVYTDNASNLPHYKLCHYDTGAKTINGITVLSGGSAYTVDSNGLLTNATITINGVNVTSSIKAIVQNGSIDGLFIIVPIATTYTTPPPIVISFPSGGDPDVDTQAMAEVTISNHSTLLSGLESECTTAGECPSTSLPTFRHFYSTANSGIKGGTYLFSLIYNKIVDGENQGEECVDEKSFQFNLELENRDISVDTHVSKCCIKRGDGCTTQCVYNTYIFSVNALNTNILGIGLGLFSWYKVRQTSQQITSAGYGATFRIRTMFYQVLDIALKTRGANYKVGDRVRILPGDAYISVTAVDGTGAITAFSIITTGSNGEIYAKACNSGASSIIATNCDNYQSTMSAPPTATTLPDGVLHYPWEDSCEYHVGYPFFTHQDVESFIPPIASSQYIDSYDPVIGIGAENVTPTGVSAFVPRIVNEGYLPLGTNGNPGCIDQDTDELYYYIIHDEITYMRAFSQPLDFGNYVYINDENFVWDYEQGTLSIQVELIGRNAFVFAGYKYEIEEGLPVWGTDNVYNPDTNTYEDVTTLTGFIPTPGTQISQENVDTYIVEGGGTTAYVTVSSNVVGQIVSITDSNGGSGYTYNNDEVETITVPSGNAQGKISYKINSDGTVGSFSIASKGARYKRNSSFRVNIPKDVFLKRGYAVFDNLHFKTNDYNTIIRARVTDANGVTFTGYTSVYRYINKHPNYTYCMYDCNHDLAKGFTLNVTVTDEITFGNGNSKCIYVGLTSISGTYTGNVDNLFKPGKILFRTTGNNITHNISTTMSDGEVIPGNTATPGNWTNVSDGVTAGQYDHIATIYVALINRQNNVNTVTDIKSIEVRVTNCNILFTVNLTGQIY